MFNLKKFNKQTINLFVLAVSILFSQSLSAQNERFHGGRGDGADVATTGVINFNTVDYVGDVFTVHIDKALDQADTTENDIINFKLTFSEAVVDLRPESIELSGDAEAQTIEITGGGTEYNIAVSGMLNNGSVIINIPGGNVHNSVGAPNMPAVIVDNEVVYLGADLTVEIFRAAGQTYLTSNDTAFFDIVFNEQVSGFETSDIQLSGTAQSQNISIEGDGKVFLTKVFDFQTDGSVSVNVPAGVATSIYGKLNQSSVNTENTVIIDHTRPDVEVKLADGQTDPAYTFPIKFGVVFSEDVVDFSGASLMYGGSPDMKITVSGNGSVYVVAVDSIITNETISIYIAENAVHDYAGNGNTEPLYSGNSVTYKGATAISSLDLKDFAKIYSEKGKLHIDFKKSPVGGVVVNIYQITGQKVVSKKIYDRFNIIELKPMQNYILQIYDKQFLFAKKIFLFP